VDDSGLGTERQAAVGTESPDISAKAITFAGPNAGRYYLFKNLSESDGADRI